jgi:hypothetical protein
MLGKAFLLKHFEHFFGFGWPKPFTRLRKPCTSLTLWPFWTSWIWISIDHIIHWQVYIEHNEHFKHILNTLITLHFSKKFNTTYLNFYFFIIVEVIYYFFLKVAKLWTEKLLSINWFTDLCNQNKLFLFVIFSYIFKFQLIP